MSLKLKIIKQVHFYNLRLDGCYEEIICKFPKLKIETNYRKRNQYFKNEQSYKCKKNPN